MPTRSTQLRASPMAVAVAHHRPIGAGVGGLNPCRRRRRLRSFPHRDLLDLPEPSSPNFQRSRSTPCFPSSTGDDARDSIVHIKIVGPCNTAGVRDLVVKAAVAMALGAAPFPADGRLGGAYFLRSATAGRASNFLAVVKPVDEEPLAVSFLGSPGSQLSIRAGETGVREAAAYLLDHAGFAGVPPTALIKISHPAFTLHRCTGTAGARLASIQRFVPHEFDAGDIGPSKFSVASVHRIGILDIRLFNTDRHAGNLLVKKQISRNGRLTTELVPIDHGLCLPELLDDPYFEWLHWPQAAVPFSDAETEYISALDPFEDAELLRSELPSLRESAIRILILCTVFLKRAAAAGLCLADIGGMMTREFCRLEEGASVLETLCRKTAEFMAADMALDRCDVCIGGDGDERTDYQFAMDCAAPALDFPLLFTSKKKEEFDPLPGAEEEQGNEIIDNRGGTITKSVSFSAAELDCDGGGISLKWMGEEEWAVFLERFERLLPEALEARKKRGMQSGRDLLPAASEVGGRRKDDDVN